MNYDSNAKYFVKPNELFRIVSIIFMAVGALLIALELTIQFDTWAVMSSGVMLTVIGAALYAFDSGKRLKDTEFDAAVRNFTALMPQKSVDKMAENHIRIKETARYEFTAFEPEADGAVSKKGGDGALRSSRVSYTAVICGTTDRRQCIVIYRNSFSLTEPYEAASAVSVLNEELSNADIIEEEHEITTVNGFIVPVRTAKISITLIDGRELDFPVKNDASADEFVNVIKRFCAKTRA